MSSADHEQPKKPFRVERKRLGRITHIDEVGKFGFIDAEDFREDVFFHITDWQDGASSGASTQPEIKMWVEFELNDEFYEREKKLRAKAVRPTDRPTGRKLAARDATFHIVTHHPNARRRRPSWRK